MIVYIICIASFLTNLLGGLISLKFRRQLYLIVAFSGGAMIGVALFDLLPTAMEITVKNYSNRTVTGVVGLGFMLYFLLDRYILVHSESNKDTGNMRKNIAALTLTTHSLIDGAAIGLAFQLSTAVGSIVAAAILLHDLADGMNITGLILKAGGERKQAVGWLFTNAIAPLTGAVIINCFRLPPAWLGLLLALLTGSFLYLGATEFLPESHRNLPRMTTAFATVTGMAVMYTIISLALF